MPLDGVSLKKTIGLIQYFKKSGKVDYMPMYLLLKCTKSLGTDQFLSPQMTQFSIIHEPERVEVIPPQASVLRQISPFPLAINDDDGRVV